MDGGRLSNAYRRCKMICVRTAPWAGWAALPGAARALRRPGDARTRGGAAAPVAAVLRN